MRLKCDKLLLKIIFDIEATWRIDSWTMWASLIKDNALSMDFIYKVVENQNSFSIVGGINIIPDFITIWQ